MTVGGDNQTGSQGRSRESEFEQRVVLDTRPCYVRYSLRGLGVFSGTLCLVLAVLNLIFHWSFLCIFFSILQGVLGFFVATTEAAGGSVRICYCIFLNRYPKCSGWVDRQPAWVKPICYILIPLPGMIFCTTWYTFFGGGFVLFTGVAYTISWWRQDPRITNSDSTPAPGNNSNISSPMGNNNNNNGTMFPKHTNNTNAYANNATTSSSPSSSQPNRPTIIDIRQNNATTTKSSSSSGGGGKASPLNPLASLSNYDSNTKGNHHSSGYGYDGGESGGGDRYENISVISGQTKNTRTPTTAMEMDWRGAEAKNTNNSFYTNVALNDDDDFGSRGAGAFPDNNPFVVQTNPGRKVTRPTKPGYDDDNEANC